VGEWSTPHPGPAPLLPGKTAGTHCTAVRLGPWGGLGRCRGFSDIYVNTQQLLLNTTLFCPWRHVSAAHTAIFRPAYNRTGPFMCAQYGIPHCLHVKYMWNKYICKTYNYIWLKGRCLRHLLLTIYNYRFYRYIYFTCTLYVNSVGSHIVRT